MNGIEFAETGQSAVAQEQMIGMSVAGAAARGVDAAVSVRKRMTDVVEAAIDQSMTVRERMRD